MQKSSMWKLAALAGVVGLGFFAVFQTQRGLQDESPTEAGSTAIPDDPGDGDGQPSAPVSEKQIRVAQREPKAAPLNNPFDDGSQDEPSAAKGAATTAVSFPKISGSDPPSRKDDGGGPQFDPQFDLGAGSAGKSATKAATRSDGGTTKPASKKAGNPFDPEPIEDGFESKSAKSSQTKPPVRPDGGNSSAADTSKSEPAKPVFGEPIGPKPAAAKSGNDSPRTVFGKKIDDPAAAAKSAGNPFDAGKTAKTGVSPKIDGAAASSQSNPFGTLPDEDKGKTTPATSGGPSLAAPAAGPAKTVASEPKPAGKSAESENPFAGGNSAKSAVKPDPNEPLMTSRKSPAKENPFAGTGDKAEPPLAKKATRNSTSTSSDLIDKPSKAAPKTTTQDDKGDPPKSLYEPSPAKSDVGEPRKTVSGGTTPFPPAGKQDDPSPTNVAAPEPKGKSPAGTGSPPRLMPVPPAAPKTTTIPSPPPSAPVINEPPGPKVTIHKTAPGSAVLGKPFIYDILIKNAGGRTAHNVIVQDPIPSGVRLEGTDPQAYLSRNNLVWKLGSLGAGESRKISVKVTPVRSGQIGSVATVNFVAETAKPIAAQPKLVFHMEGPQKARLGDRISFRFTVSNVGSSAATDVWLRDIIPDGLKHPGGDDLEYKIGTLPAGKSESISLPMTVAKAGRLTNRAVITAAGGVRIEAKSAVNVAAAKLVISRTGPSRRVVGRPAVYQNMVTNGSIETVPNATLVEALPAGMDFVSASDGGKFDAVRRTVAWSLGPLGPGKSKTVQLQLLPKQTGVQNSVVQATGADGSTVQTASATKVVGYAALGIDVPALDQPVNIGEQVTLRVIGRNRGTAASSNVKITVTLPAQLDLVSVRGPGKYTVAGRTITFATIDSLAGKNRAVYDLTVKAVAQGDSRVRVQIQSDEMSKPLHREEAVLVLPPSP